MSKRQHISHLVTLHYIFKNLLYSKALIRQTKYVVMMTKEGSTKNCKFHDPQGLVSDVRRGHISHSSEYVLSSSLSIYRTTLSIYSTWIAIVLRDYDDAYFLDH